MINENELLANWGDQKISHNYWRLVEPCETEFEFIARRGHPSSYAYVKFACKPADEISLDFAVEWPNDFKLIYTLRIRNSIAEAVLDALFINSDKRAYRGCQLVLIDFRWDEVGGSEIAVYRATLQAMGRLRDVGRWVEVTSRYREYREA